MNRANKTAYSAAGIAATAIAGWQMWPAFDGIFFTQAEAADVAQVQRATNYRDRIAILKLQLLHETDPQEITMLRDVLEYYQGRLREIEDGEL